MCLICSFYFLWVVFLHYTHIMITIIHFRAVEIRPASLVERRHLDARTLLDTLQNYNQDT